MVKYCDNKIDIQYYKLNLTNDEHSLFNNVIIHLRIRQTSIKMHVDIGHCPISLVSSLSLVSLVVEESCLNPVVLSPAIINSKLY